MIKPKKQKHIAHLLATAHRRMVSQLSVELKPMGISMDMWTILGILKDQPGQPMTSLADSLSLNLPTVTKLMDRMVSDNLTYRKSHHSDRRRVLIFPTERGLELFYEVDNIANNLEQRLKDKLGNLAALKEELSKL
jgi:DNA-binding MarR family transcriptional regulator